MMFLAAVFVGSLVGLVLIWLVDRGE